MEEEDNDVNESVIGKIENREDPSQAIEIKYLRKESAFVTNGIYSIFAEKELLIPTHLIAVDFQLIGAIISAILEKLSVAGEAGGTFAYCREFDVLGKTYYLTDHGEYVKLSLKDG